MADLHAYNLKIVLILTVGFGLASLLGYFSYRLKLSPILGYLVTGYIIGPYSPGFVADLQISEQLAEIGVILMMFGVGLHFQVKDLIEVKHIAIPGAVIQTLASTLAATLLIHLMGWSLETGVIIGLAVGVASTVVLVRILSDFNLLDTTQGHIAIGWLVVEDILTVLVLVLLPTIADDLKESHFSFGAIIISIFFVFFKFILLILIMFTIGRKIVTYILSTITKINSHELFTVTIIALIFGIATGSAFLFGTSIALGAFIAGMVIGQTDSRQQAFVNSLPMQDTFIVVFFLTVGMLFNPVAIQEHFLLFIGVLSIILIIKPLTAFLIVFLLRYPFKTAMIIAISLAQIGEFSFILAESAMNLEILPDEGYDVIVACALISISLNPLLFRWLKPEAEQNLDTPSSSGHLNENRLHR